MPANDPLHDDLYTAYGRFLGRRARKRRIASVGVLAAVAAVCAALVSVAAFNASGTPANASGPGSDAYIRCLNDHGWPVGAGLSIDPSGIAPAPGTIDAAVAACADLENGILDALRPSDEALRQLAEQADRFVSCMRNHGVDPGAPDVVRTRAGIGVTFPGLNPNATGFDDAYAACRSIMNAYG
jgi:hypothetical protein